MRYLIRLAFVGTAYCGWQSQSNGPSVQAQVMNAVRKVCGTVDRFSGCSRTDSGVHALDFCAAFTVSRFINPENLMRALNANLPPDISVFSAAEVPDSFHPRYDVKKKEYLYRIDPSPVRSPFLLNRVWHRPGRYDPDFLNRAAAELTGIQDFRSFMAAGSRITDCTRHVFDAHFECSGRTVDFYVSADGFLYHMVRIMVGTLLEAAKRDDPDYPRRVLAARNRNAAGMTAPACGLYLNRVFYDETEGGTEWNPKQNEPFADWI